MHILEIMLPWENMMMCMAALFSLIMVFIPLEFSMTMFLTRQQITCKRYTSKDNVNDEDLFLFKIFVIH